MLIIIFDSFGRAQKQSSRPNYILQSIFFLFMEHDLSASTSSLQTFQVQVSRPTWAQVWSLQLCCELCVCQCCGWMDAMEKLTKGSCCCCCAADMLLLLRVVSRKSSSLMFQSVIWVLFSHPAKTSRLHVIPQAQGCGARCLHMELNQSVSLVASQTQVNLPAT